VAVTEKIRLAVEKLPLPAQIQVLDYIEYLAAKSAEQDNRAWSELSLASAMRGMEHEDGPEYTAADLRVVFQ
jgi:hypothetical protein